MKSKTLQRAKQKQALATLKLRTCEINSMFIPENYIMIKVTPDQLKKICKKQNQKALNVFKLPDGSMISFGERDVVFVVEPARNAELHEKEGSGAFSI
ncbi:MAG: hypothetical protein QXZ70_06675 [Candidatus Bathyarchaeia archaeon]